MLALENIIIPQKRQESVDSSICLYEGDYVVKKSCGPRRYDKGLPIKTCGFLS